MSTLSHSHETGGAWYATQWRVPGCPACCIPSDLTWWLASLDPTEHCFREDNCIHHQGHQGPECCCCGRHADMHTGCDCD